MTLSISPSNNFLPLSSRRLINSHLAWHMHLRLHPTAIPHKLAAAPLGTICPFPAHAAFPAWLLAKLFELCYVLIGSFIHSYFLVVQCSMLWITALSCAPSPPVPFWALTHLITCFRSSACSVSPTKTWDECTYSGKVVRARFGCHFKPISMR